LFLEPWFHRLIKNCVNVLKQHILKLLGRELEALRELKHLSGVVGGEEHGVIAANNDVVVEPYQLSQVLHPVDYVASFLNKT
jgi:hypothetical protein